MHKEPTLNIESASEQTTIVRPALNRVRQFFRALAARIGAGEYDLVAARLTPAQAGLFQRMPRCDQRHCLDVFCALLSVGHRDEHLLQAALVHDVGKSAARLRIWHRVAVVLLGRFAPGWLRQLAANGRGWSRPFAVHVHHAELGANWAAEAGCSPEVASLIRRHHEPQPDDKPLVALQRADRQN